MDDLHGGHHNTTPRRPRREKECTLAHLLVTGGAGYIGSHTLLALREAGHTAVVVDDLRAGHAFLAGDAPLERVDVCDREALESVFARHRFDGVLHFAAYLDVAESLDLPLAYYRNNVGGSTALLETALAHDCRAFVLSSTCATYGVPDRVPIREDTPQRPIHPYGASKLVVEWMLAAAERAHGLRWAALRYFNAAGADPDGRAGECHEPEIHMVPSALRAVAGLREGLTLYGSDYDTPDGTCVRDYIHVTDLADAHVRAIEALLEGRQVGAYNLGTGRGTSNRQVVEAVERVVGRPVPVTDGPRRQGDPPELVADASRFRRDFGWEARLSGMDEIVGTAWAWLQKWKAL